MGLFGSRKLLLVLVVTAYVFSGSAEAWSWSWGSGGRSGSSWGWRWGSGGSSASGSGSNSGGSSYGWGWSSDEPDTDWHWRSSSGSNHSSGSGSTHNHTTPSNNSSGIGSTHNNHTAPSNHSGGAGSTSNNHNHTAPILPLGRNIHEVVVWINEFDYQEWALKRAPFYINDIFVFKYKNESTKHNVAYLLPDLKSYNRCDLTRGKKLQRGGITSGFKFLLRKTQTYYFASGDLNDCNRNSMKFSLTPIPRSNSHTNP